MSVVGTVHALCYKQTVRHLGAAGQEMEADCVLEPAQNFTGPISRDWVKLLANYRDPSHARSAFELVVTAGAFAVFWSLTWAALEFGYWVALIVAVPAAGFLVRLFLIQHDCGHGSFLRRRAANDWIGRVISTLTLAPYDAWRHSHAVHHASSGNLARRGIGDVFTLTVSEYLERSRIQRLGYRLYRHPFVMFGLGPAYLFIVRYRLPPSDLRHSGWQSWLSTMATNAAIACVVVLMTWMVGVKPFLQVHLPIMLLAASIGVWMFYIQHQFEDTYWAQPPAWSQPEAALHGSSHYDLPGVLRWFTANIGVHHVHHISSRIPYYRLPCVMRDFPELKAVGRLTLLQSFACVRLALWDEQSGRLISFKDLKRLPAIASKR